MFLKIAPRENPEVEITPVEAIRILPKPEVDDTAKAAQEAEIRRQMYERMARGSALAEAEDNAHRKQRGL